MGKHSAPPKHRERLTPPKPTTHRPKPPPTVVPPTPKPQSSSTKLRDAATRVLGALPPVIDHLEHAPGCPFGGGGPCMCGRNELISAVGELRDALEP